jgi:hypothetical protein
MMQSEQTQSVCELYTHKSFDWNYKILQIRVVFQAQVISKIEQNLRYQKAVIHSTYKVLKSVNLMIHQQESEIYHHHRRVPVQIFISFVTPMLPVSALVYLPYEPHVTFLTVLFPHHTFTSLLFLERLSFSFS